MCTAVNDSIWCERVWLRRYAGLNHTAASSPSGAKRKPAARRTRRRRRKRRSPPRRRRVAALKDASRVRSSTRPRRPPTPGLEHWSGARRCRRDAPSEPDQIGRPDAAIEAASGSSATTPDAAAPPPQNKNLEAYAPRVVVSLHGLPEVARRAKRLHLGRVRPSRCIKCS